MNQRFRCRQKVRSETGITIRGVDQLRRRQTGSQDLRRPLWKDGDDHWREQNGRTGGKASEAQWRVLRARYQSHV